MGRALLTFAVIFVIISAWFLVTPIPTVKKHIKSRPTPQVSINPSISPSQTQKNIEVLTPTNLQTVGNPFLVKGRARVFENVVSIKLISTEGSAITQTTTYTKNPDVGQFGDFEKVISFQTTSSDGILEVFQVSPKDGSEVDKVSIPLSFK